MPVFENKLTMISYEKITKTTKMRLKEKIKERILFNTLTPFFPMEKLLFKYS